MTTTSIDFGSYVIKTSRVCGWCSRIFESVFASFMVCLPVRKMWTHLLYSRLVFCRKKKLYFYNHYVEECHTSSIDHRRYVVRSVIVHFFNHFLTFLYSEWNCPSNCIQTHVFYFFLLLFFVKNSTRHLARVTSEHIQKIVTTWT